MKTPDDVCKAFADQEIKLSISNMDEETVLIEGDEISLEFLGHLILRQARFGKDCGFQISPKGTGKTFFAEQSKTGVYIHRTPCNHMKE